MKFDSIVFDLDGTLWDTTPACAIAWNNVVARHGVDFRPIVVEDVRRVTGRPHDDCIRETFTTVDESMVQKLIEGTAVEDVEVIDRMGGVVYEGVREGLEELAKRYPLFIVSNCQSGYIEKFLAKTGFHSFIQDFECYGNTYEPKSENLRSVIERNGLKNPIMIGDASGDHVAAIACGIPFALVTYGFGSTDRPDYTFGDFPSLVTMLLSE